MPACSRMQKETGVRLLAPAPAAAALLKEGRISMSGLYSEKTGKTYDAVLPVDPALESAITGEDTSLKQKTCPVCGKAYLPTTSQAYCSDSCRTFARRKSERERKRRIRKN